MLVGYYFFQHTYMISLEIVARRSGDQPGCCIDHRTIGLAVIVVYGGSAWLVLLLYGTLTLVSGAVRGVSPSRIGSLLRPGSNRRL